jgi:hypothetical protein
MSVKPYFWSENTYTVKLDKLEAPIELDKLEAPAKPNELEASAKLDKLEVPLPTLEVPRKLTKPIKPTIKRGRGRSQKHPITKNYLTSIGISVRQTPPIDILVLV